MADTQEGTQTQTGATSAQVSEFDVLLNKQFNPQTDTAKREIEGAVRTLAQQALVSTQLISTDVLQSIEAMIAEIDKKLSEQINVIMHHPDFQQLESAWRGLHYLVSNSETDEMLKIRVLNVSKKDLHKTLKRFKGTAWDQSPTFKKLYEEEYGTLGGEPFGCLVGDYYFDHGPQDVEFLGEMAKIAAAAHAPFLAAAAPTVFQMESWQELANPRDLTKIFQIPEYAGWRSLRDSDDARYLGLAMPRFLARRPYGAKTNPVEEFDFEEDANGSDAKKYTWANSAYAMAVNINRSFKNGFMPLVYKKNTDFAAFIGAQSLHKPSQYDDPDATSNATLAARLPYLFATCRFAHYLKCIVRDKIGSFKEADDMQRWLQNWIVQYVDGDPAHSSEGTKARKPLAAAEVTVEPVEGNPGYYASKFFLRPHYQLEGLTVSLRLVAKLPSAKAS
jgi:type VI secretion system protein ImpC